MVSSLSRSMTLRLLYMHRSCRPYPEPAAIAGGGGGGSLLARLGSLHCCPERARSRHRSAACGAAGVQCFSADGLVADPASRRFVQAWHSLPTGCSMTATLLVFMVMTMSHGCICAECVPAPWHGRVRDPTF